MPVIFDWLTDRLTFPPHVSKALFLTPNGSERSQSEVKWCVPPAPSSPGKQSTASRNTWRFARRSVGDTAVHQTCRETETIVNFLSDLLIWFHNKRLSTSLLSLLRDEAACWKMPSILNHRVMPALHIDKTFVNHKYCQTFSGWVRNKDLSTQSCNFHIWLQLSLQRY